MLYFTKYTSPNHEVISIKRARFLIIVKKNQIYLNIFKINEANKVTNYMIHFEKCFSHKKLIQGRQSKNKTTKKPL